LDEFLAAGVASDSKPLAQGSMAEGGIELF
jgi:hypothetical protein